MIKSVIFINNIYKRAALTLFVLVRTVGQNKNIINHFNIYGKISAQTIQDIKETNVKVQMFVPFKSQDIELDHFRKTTTT